MFAKDFRRPCEQHPSDIKPNPGLQHIYNPEGKQGLNREKTNNMQTTFKQNAR